jgi:hypothetical protein
LAVLIRVGRCGREPFSHDAAGTRGKAWWRNGGEPARPRRPAAHGWARRHCAVHASSSDDGADAPALWSRRAWAACHAPSDAASGHTTAGRAAPAEPGDGPAEGLARVGHGAHLVLERAAPRSGLDGTSICPAQHRSDPACAPCAGATHAAASVRARGSAPRRWARVPSLQLRADAAPRAGTPARSAVAGRAQRHARRQARPPA